MSIHPNSGHRVLCRGAALLRVLDLTAFVDFIAASPDVGGSPQDGLSEAKLITWLAEE
jgi:hypothetical protein